MLKKILSTVCFLSSFIFASASFAGPRVAVMDFDNRAQHGGWRIGRGAADMLTTELVKATDFEIFERDRLASIIEEQNLGQGGRIDPTTAARIGKLIGVQYIITGAVTEYGQSKSGGGGAGVHVGKSGYSTAVDVRVVNATTGRIVFAESGEGRKTSMNVRVMGIGGGEKWNEKHATKSMRMAIEEVSKKIAKADLTAKGKSSAGGGPIGDVKVADVEGNLLTLNKGENAGLKKGDVLVVKRQRKVIKDPETGAILKVKYTKLGKVKVTEVDESYSEATVIEGSGFQAGDSVASK